MDSLFFIQTALRKCGILISCLILHSQAAEELPADAIKRLGSPSVQERLKITKELWAAGEASLQVLDEAERSQEPEVAMRAAEIREKINMGIRPDDSPELIAMIETFYRQPEEKQTNTLYQLAQKKKYRLAVLLAERARKEKDKARLLKVVRGYAVLEARLLITAAKADEAEVWLRSCAKSDPSNYIALADLLVSQGRFAQELQALGEQQDAGSKFLRLALHRVSGNQQETMQLARQEKIESLTTTMEILDGNPLPYLKNHLGDDPLSISYTALMQSLRNAEKPALEHLNFLVKTANRGNSDLEEDGEKNRAITMLFALGFDKQGCSALRSNYPAYAFFFYAFQERDEQALNQMGLEGKTPDYDAYARQQIKRIIAEENAYNNPLLYLICWLERRGLWEILDRDVIPRIVELAKTHPEIYDDMTEYIFYSDESSSPVYAPHTFAKVTEIVSADDQIVWQALLNKVFSNKTQRGGVAEKKDVELWWIWLGELEPDLSFAERFALFMRLFCKMPDENKSRDILLRKISEWHKNADPEEIEKKMPLFHALQSIAPAKLLEEIATPKQIDPVADFIRKKQWDKAAASLAEFAKKTPEQPWLILHQAICLRMAGEDQAAAELDQRYRSLVLGDAQECIVAAQLHATYNMLEQAQAYSQRALFLSHAGKSSWLSILDSFARHSMESGKWNLAAAAFEASLAHVLRQQDEDLLVYSSAYRYRMNANMAQGLALLAQQREKGLVILKECHTTLLADASLADDFFPSLRRCGLTQQHDTWFEQSWQAMNLQSQRYPGYDNIKNSMAWLAARAKLRLDEAKILSQRSLEIRPEQAAYLDTMAEIHFAGGDRSKAIAYSSHALFVERDDSQLLRQHFRFISGELP